MADEAQTADARKVVPFLRVEQARPFVNGRCFSDLHHVAPSGWTMLYDRELVYATTFHVGADAYCGHIIAGSWEQAEALALERGLGEVVDGVIGGIIPA